MILKCPRCDDGWKWSRIIRELVPCHVCNQEGSIDLLQELIRLQNTVTELSDRITDIERTS